MAVYTETVELKDNISPAAEKAAKEMKILDAAVVSVENALVKAGATGNVKSFQSLTKQLDSLKAAQSVIPKGLLDEAKAHGDASKAAGSATKSIQNLADAEGGASASSGGLQAELAELTGGLSLVVEALGAVALGFGVVVLAGAKMAIEASEAKNKMISLFNALGEGRIKGEEVDDMLDDMRSKLGVTKDSLVPLTKGFLTMGITGKEQLESLVTAAASANAIVEGGGEAFTKMYKQINAAQEAGQKLTIPFKKLTTQLAGMGLNIDDLAKAMNLTSKEVSDGLSKGTIDAKKFGDALENAVKTKGADPLQTLANSSANLGALLKEYIGDMFEDLGKDIAPFMSAVRDLFSIFDSKAKPSGQVLKTGIEAFFKNVFVQATKVVPYIKHFLLDVIIYGLKAYISLKPIIAWFQELRKNQTVVNAVMGAFKVLVVILIAVAVVIGVIVGVLVLLWAASIALVVGVYALIAAFGDFLQSVGKAIIDWVKSATSAASDFIAGLVSGISSGAGAVVEAITNLAGQAKGAFKKALGIASPSKVMMQMGGFVGQGAAEGIEASAGGVQKASASLAGAAAGGFSSGGADNQGGKSGGSSAVNVQATINFNGAVQGAQELTEQAVTLIFERIALEQGV